MTDQQILGLFQSELSETSQPSSPFVTASRILDIAARTLKDYGCEYYPAIRTAADMAFEQFVRPIDFPLIDGELELGIETGVKNLMLQGMDAINLKFCGVSG